MRNKALVLDTENTIWNKGSPFDSRNKNVCISFANETSSGVLFGDYLQIQDYINRSDLLVFFNAKYDLHWLRRLGIDFEGRRIWCCQVFEFLHGRQQEPYPSLNNTLQKYGLGQKLEVVSEYWNKGINTDDIPKDVLAKYAEEDARLTYQVYLKQKEIQRPSQKTLFSLQMQDLLVLEEMEWHGIYFQKEKSLQKVQELEKEIERIQQDLNIYHSVPNFNWSSSDHLSALLYGGEIVEARRIPAGVYKTGVRAGQTKFRIEEVVHQLPRLYKPIKGSELKKTNKWSVEEQYLLQLKGDQSLISGILKIKELQKLCSTYYAGLPNLHTEQNWEENILHTSFNQCVASTGRLSSTRPNLQNISEKAQELFTTRWTSTTESTSS